tara:strand:+ start:103 stop:447 length:345 start_codon:yes stop_codon:yes gene_type:complete
MDVDGWYIVTPQYYTAENIILTEITSAARLDSRIERGECIKADPIAFGSALVSQALITCQALDHGLQFKDRSALRLSTAQRKQSVYIVARKVIINRGEAASTCREGCLPALDGK